MRERDDQKEHYLLILESKAVEWRIKRLWIFAKPDSGCKAILFMDIYIYIYKIPTFPLPIFCCLMPLNKF